MKLLIIIVILFTVNLFSQSPGWSQLSKTELVFALETDSESIWIGGDAGLIRKNLNTGENKYYNNANSPLDSNWIWFLYKDRTGNLWVKSNSLQRFDGVYWNELADLYPQLSGYKINAMVQDIYSNYWLTSDTTIIRISADSLKLYNRTEHSIPLEHYRNIVTDSSGGIYFKGEVGLVYFDGNEFRTLSNDSTNNEIKYITDMEIENNGSLWVCTEYFGVFEFNGSDWIKHLEPQQDDFVYGIFIDESGTKWFGNYGSGILSFDDTSWIYWQTDSIAVSQLHDIAQDKNGNLWFGNTNGLVRFDGNSWRNENLSDVKILNNNCLKMIIDHDGTYWISTFLGMNIFSDNEWSTYTYQNSPLGGLVYDFLEDDDGSMWIGSYGLYNYNESNWMIYTTENSGLPDNTIKDIKFSSDGSLWLATRYGGIAKKDGDDWTVINTSNSSLPSDNTSGLLFDSNGRLWVSTSDAGLAFLNNGDWVIKNTDNSSLPSNKINDIIEMNSAIWIATSNGLALLEYTHLWTVYNSQNSDLQSDEINSLYPEKDDILWIGTDDGVARIENDSLVLFTPLNSGLPFNRVNNVYVDKWGVKWFSTASGIGRYEDENTLSLSEKDILGIANFDLHQNYPNPFNPSTKISFSICERSYVTLMIYDITGQLIEQILSQYLNKGDYEVDFVASNLSSGVYFYRLESGKSAKVGKMLFLK